MQSQVGGTISRRPRVVRPALKRQVSFEGDIARSGDVGVPARPRAPGMRDRDDLLLR
jgi:hypothetical protein